MRARSMKVIDLAVRHVECISATTSVTDCALAMRTRHVGSLVVVDGGNKPIGMITYRCHEGRRRDDEPGGRRSG